MKRVGRRNQLEIITSILKIASVSDPITKTGIVYGTNLDFKRVCRYLEILEKLGLISMTEKGGKRLYYTSEKGRSFLTDLEKLAER